VFLWPPTSRLRPSLVSLANPHQLCQTILQVTTSLDPQLNSPAAPHSSPSQVGPSPRGAQLLLFDLPDQHPLSQSYECAAARRTNAKLQPNIQTVSGVRNAKSNVPSTPSSHLIARLETSALKHQRGLPCPLIVSQTAMPYREVRTMISNCLSCT
jgi:hypothetical protein